MVMVSKIDLDIERECLRPVKAGHLGKAVDDCGGARPGE